MRHLPHLTFVQVWLPTSTCKLQPKAKFLVTLLVSYWSISVPLLGILAAHFLLHTSFTLDQQHIACWKILTWLFLVRPPENATLSHVNGSPLLLASSFVDFLAVIFYFPSSPWQLIFVPRWKMECQLFIVILHDDTPSSFPPLRFWLAVWSITYSLQSRWLLISGSQTSKLRLCRWWKIICWPCGRKMIHHLLFWWPPVHRRKTCSIVSKLKSLPNKQVKLIF